MNNIYERLEKVRKESPLVHHITNYVTVSSCADITKRFGASPVMADAIEEVADMTSIARALVLNIGTLNSRTIESMKLSGKTANEKNIPIVLDVCGAGATKFRNEKCEELLKTFHADVIKGNVSEIATIAGLNITTKGVDATEVKTDVVEMAKNLALKLKSVIVITGKQDIISNGKDTYTVSNGVSVMGDIVGTGCMASSVIGSFCAIEKDYAFASACALVCYEVAAENTSKFCNEAGTFKENMFNSISKLDEQSITEKAKLVKL